MNAAEWVLLSTIRIETTIPNGISTGTEFFLVFVLKRKLAQAFQRLLLINTL